MNKKFLSNLIKSAIIFFAVLFLMITISRVFFPMDFGNFESVVWKPAELAVSGQNPYSYALTEPFVLAPYGYFYYLIVGCGLKLFGHQFWFARILSVLATCIIIYSVIRIGRVFSNDWVTISIPVIFLLSSVPLLSIYGLQRPDLPALSLIATSFILAVKRFEQKRKMATPPSFKFDYLQIILISLICFSAVFFKQTFVLGSVFLFLWFISQREIKSAIIFVVTGIIFVSTTVTILNFTSNGEYFWQHFVLMRGIPVYYERAVEVLQNVLLNPTTLLGLMVLLLLPIINFRKLSKLEKRVSIVILSGYFAFAAILGLVTSTRGGSSANYYLEVLFATSILMLPLLNFISRRKIRQIILAVLLICGSFQLIRNLRGEYFHWQSYSYNAEIIKTYNERVAKDELGISIYANLIVAADREYHFSDVIQYVDGRSPELKQFFISALKSRRYQAIIWDVPNDSFLLSEYKMIPMTTPIPVKGNYPVYLYVLKD